MVAREAASKYREKCKKPKKPILVGDPKECPPCATAQIKEFLGAPGFCWIWIPNYSLLAKPLYGATKGRGQKSMVWGEKQQKKAFKKN
jgi:hypothetical protein